MHRKNASIVAPVLVWSALQIISLLLSAGRVQLWANVVHPTENYAMKSMFATQIIAAAMLFPWLMRDSRSTVFVILTTAPFLQLSGMLADETGAGIVWSITQMWIWLIALAAWRTVLTTQRMQSIGVAITTCMTIGGGCVWYLRMEFAGKTFEPNVIHIAFAAVVVGGLIAAAVARNQKLSTDY